MIASGSHPHFCDCLECLGGFPAEATRLIPMAREERRSAAMERRDVMGRRRRARELREQRGGQLG
jgi:hypothetical protein